MQNLTPDNEPQQSPVEIRSVITVYGVISLLAIFWGFFQHRLIPWRIIPFADINIFADIVIGIVVSMPIILFSSISTNKLQWARRLRKIFLPIIAPLPAWKIFIIAAASSIAEELFFRGAMQPVFGIVVTSILFGIVHYPVKRELIPWSIMALIMGFILGFLFNWRGSIVAPIVCHFFINFCNILNMNRSYKSEDY